MVVSTQTHQCGCVYTDTHNVHALQCEIMLTRRYFTFTIAGKRWAGRERERGSDNIFGTAFTHNSFSFSLLERCSTHPRMRANAHLRATAAGRLHFSVNVLFQLKLWLVGFLHGPVLKFSDKRQKRVRSHSACRWRYHNNDSDWIVLQHV